MANDIKGCQWIQAIKVTPINRVFYIDHFSVYFIVVYIDLVKKNGKIKYFKIHIRLSKI